MDYDLIVIGGGPAGYLGAQRAAEAGLKVKYLKNVKLAVSASTKVASVQDICTPPTWSTTPEMAKPAHQSRFRRG